MRLIDADKLDWWYKGRNIRRVIDEAPTIDAVPVVRCKDCKHYKKDTLNARYCNHKTGGLSCFPEEDNFCSYGERRE